MELVWKELDPVRLTGSFESSVLVEGLLPPPEGRGVEEILCSDATVGIDTVKLGDGCAEIFGTITAKLLVRDGEGIYAFDSKADFTHTAEAEGASAGMEASASASVRSLKMQLAEGGAAMSAEISIFVTMTSETPFRVIGGVNGITDLELKTETASAIKRTVLGSEKLRMREELAEAGIAEVLTCGGIVTVRDAIADRDGVTVSGVLMLNALTKDGDGRISSLQRQVPFREKLGIEASPGRVECTAVPLRTELHTLGEEFAIAAMEAEILFTVYGSERQELTFPTDAFSPSMGFDCLIDEAEILSYSGRSSHQAQLKETLDLPDSMAEMAYPMLAAARPQITAVEADEAELTVSGILTTTVVYESMGANVYSYTDDIPFCVKLASDYACNMPQAQCECAVQITGSTERSLQLLINMQFEIDRLDTTVISTVAGLAEREPAARMPGLLIGFASNGEGVFDIAKRYSVSCESVRRLNPDIAEPFVEGERLLLLV